MMRMSAAILPIIFGAMLSGCAAQMAEAPFAGPVFADVDCRASGTGTVVAKQNCSDLEVDDQTGAIVNRTN